MNSKVPVARGTTVKPLVPTDIESSYRMATAFAKSNMLPKSYTGGAEEKAAKAFTAMQLGAEVGLMPMQAIQNIAVINGQPSIWGDAQKAIVMTHPDYIDMVEEYEGDWQGRDDTDPLFSAICVVKRQGRSDVIAEFSIQDAIDAGLWDKAGPWRTHPKRMLRYKARAFALRDAFPDALKGLTHTAEELEGEMIDVTPPPQSTSSNLEERLKQKQGESNEPDSTDATDSGDDQEDGGSDDSDDTSGAGSDATDNADRPNGAVADDSEAEQAEQVDDVVESESVSEGDEENTEAAADEAGSADSDDAVVIAMWDRQSVFDGNSQNKGWTVKDWKNVHTAGKHLIASMKKYETSEERQDILRKNDPLVAALIQEGHGDMITDMHKVISEGKDASD